MEQIYYLKRPHTAAAEKHTEAQPAAAELRAAENRLTAEARHLMATDLARLLDKPHNHHLQWTGSTADLMEAAHAVYTEGCLHHADGQPLTFGQIVGRACRLLNVRQPANPRSLARRAEERKGIRTATLLYRYRHWLGSPRQPSPMALCIGQSPH